MACDRAPNPSTPAGSHPGGPTACQRGPITGWSTLPPGRKLGAGALLFAGLSVIGFAAPDTAGSSIAVGHLRTVRIGAHKPPATHDRATVVSDSDTRVAPASGTASWTDRPAAPTPFGPAVVGPTTPTTAFEAAGSGGSRTGLFTTRGAWDIAYTYDCSHPLGRPGEFLLTVRDSGGFVSEDTAGVERHGTTGSEVAHIPSGGTYYLSLDTACDWNIQVFSP